MNRYIKNAAFIIICLAAVGIMWNQSHSEIRQETEESVDSSETAVQEVTFPGEYQQEVNRVFSIDAKVVIPEDFNPNQLCRASAKIYELDIEKWKSRFLTGTEIFDVDPEGGMSREGDDLLRELYQTEGEGNLYLSSQEGFYYDAGRYLPINSGLEFHENKGTADHFSETAELENISRSDAWNGLMKELDALGIHTDDFQVQYAYALDYETLGQKEQEMLQEEYIEPEETKGSWTSEDNAYYYCLLQKDQGLPVFYPEEVMEYEEDIYFGAVMSYYGASGLIGLNVNCLFDITDGKEKIYLAPFETITDTLIKKYEQVIMDSEITVTEFRLFQYPLRRGKDTYEIIPVWICKLEYKDSDSVMYIPIHAVTGEEMLEME